MKTYTLFVVLMLAAVFSLTAFAQNRSSNDKIWSRVQVNPEKVKQPLQDPNWRPAPQLNTFYDAATVGPNIRPNPTTNSTQSETSIDIHPTNKDIIFCSANATSWPVSTLYGSGVYWSTNGSSSWTSYDNPPFGGNSGDPASVIGSDGRFYENYISSSGGQGVSVSTNNGVNWTSYTVTPNPGDLADKNHYMVDKKTGSPYVNRSYCSWTDFGGSNNNQAVCSYSTNYGATWSSISNLSGSLTPGSHAQGVNVQTGPNGEVYVCFAIYDAWPGGEDAIGFAKSTNGGVSWTSARVYSASNFGIRGNLSSKSGIRVSSFPSMAVDRSGGAYNGTIYITWPQISVSPAGSDPDIVVIKSTNGGTTWTSPVRVNNDPLNNGKDQYYPWCTVDQSDGRFMIVFYDSRNVANSQAEVYMASSSDGGATFDNFKVSDQAHTPAPIAGLASGYAGDYIGVAAYNGVAYPYWGDNRTGIYQGWTAKVTFGPPCPVNSATNPAPANGATNVSISLGQLSWTNGSGATRCEVWFGAGTPSLVYSGTLISSWTIPSALTYNTNYSWQIIDKNDTCSANSEMWSFRTELSPGIVFTEPFNNLNNWTAIGPLGTTNWIVNSSVNAGGTSPELELNWSPEFNGVSKLRSVPISVQNNRHYSVSFKHFVDWYANTAPSLGIGVSYDNGATYTPIWSIVPTGNVGPASVTAPFITPASGSPENTNLYLVFFCNGNSFNIDYWYIDDLVLTDDDFLAINNPTGFTATGISQTQINVAFTPNGNNNPVVIVWNQTGTFTTPSGAPPAVGQAFAGGTLLYNGTTSPVSHTGLTAGTTYYYKAFSYVSATTSYSTGVAANASTLQINNPSGFTAAPVSSSQINVSFTPNSNNNNVIIVWNQTGTFTTPAGIPPAVGQPFAGGTLLSNGTTSPVAHTGVTPGTIYYYKAFSYASPSYSSGVTANAIIVADPLNFNATAVNGTQIDLTFNPNSYNNNVIIVWNLTGTFTTPAGTPPAVGQPFAGGTLLSNGTTSPVNHTGLTPGTTYYYKAFSYSAPYYSAGVTANAGSLIIGDPVNFMAVPASGSQIYLSFTPNAALNDVVIVWNLTGTFTAPSGVPPSAGQPFAGGTLLYHGIVSPVSHTGLNPSTTYYYKAFSYSAPGYSAGVTANASTLGVTTFQLTVNVLNGWNIVSIPGLHPVNQNVNTWWPGRDPASSVFKFNSGYQAVTEVQPGIGYWMKHLGANTYNTGDEWPAGGILLVNHAPIPALQGWNLFGGYEEAVPAAGVTTTPSGLITGSIYQYQTGYTPATTLTPGTGYFIKLTGAGQINIQGPGPMNPVVVPSTEGFGRIIISDALQRNYVLYVADDQSDLNYFELPPYPPQGMFDIRYSSQRSAERITVPQGIEMMGIAYPVTIKAAGTGIILSDMFGNEIARLKDGEETTLNSSAEKLIVSEYIIPEEYSLEQNYPNPFNPETTIRFSLPEDATNVRVSIYNSLGQEVAELVNRQLSAGTYQYRWNATDMASGLYIYQIVTPQFSSVKKMVVLK